MTYRIHCEWLPANNFLFQIANVWLVLSYLCPPTLNGLLYLRLTLGFAGLFFSLWGWIVLCAPDTFIWNLLFFVGNFLHLAYILFSRRSRKFSHDMEIIFENIFKTLRVPRHQFGYLAEAEVDAKCLSAGQIFAIDGVTQSKSLSVLVEGRLDVRKHGQVVHTIEANQFVNSPEWIVSQVEPYIFEVTMQAKTECKIISWDRIKLLAILKKNAYLKSVVDAVVSRDVAQKLFAMNQMIRKSGQGLAHSIYSLNEIGDDDRGVHVVLNHHDEGSESTAEEHNFSVKTSLLSIYHTERETHL